MDAGARRECVNVDKLIIADIIVDIINGTSKVYPVGIISEVIVARQVSLCYLTTAGCRGTERGRSVSIR